MSQWVGKNLAGRLWRKLLLKPQQGAGAEFPLFPQLVPSVSVDNLLTDLIMANSPAKDVSAASGATTMFEVPANKIWTMLIIMRPATTGSSQTYLKDDQGRNISLDASGAGQSRIFPPQALRLRPGWGLQMLNTNNVGDNAAVMAIVYSEEDAS